MKSFTKFLFSAVILLHANVLLAMENVVPSAIEKGAEALGEELGVFGKKTAPAQIAIATTAVVPSSVGSSSFSVASAMVSDQIVLEASGEENTTNQFLEDEICNNIYQSCLAKVATMSLEDRKTAEGIAQEKEEWEAAKDMAIEDKESCERALAKATKAAAEAQKQFDSANAIVHGKAYADMAYYKWQVADLAEKLAEARVETARATLNAIKFRNTAQRAKAEAKLAEAIEMECNASKALDAATANTSSASSSNNSPISLSLPKPPVLGSKAVAIEQNFAIPSIPIATAVEFHTAHNPTIAEPLNQLKLSEERAAKEKAAAFEAEFSTMIESAKAQTEEAAIAATAAREKAVKLGASEKEWGEAMEEAEIAEAAYIHLIGIYTTHQAHVADHYEGYIVETKRSKYNLELKKAEKKKGHWTNEIEECRQEKEALKHGSSEKALQEREAFLAQQAKEKGDFIAKEKIRLEAEAAIAREREVLEMQKKKRAEDEADLLAKQKELAKEKEILAREQALAQREAEAAKNQEKIKREEAAVLIREREVLEAVNKVKADAEAAVAAQAKILAQEQAREDKAKAAQEREAARIAEQERARLESEKKAVEEEARIAEKARVERVRQAALEKVKQEEEAQRKEKQKVIEGETKIASSKASPVKVTAIPISSTDEMWAVINYIHPIQIEEVLQRKGQQKIIEGEANTTSSKVPSVKVTAIPTSSTDEMWAVIRDCPNSGKF